MFTATLKHHSIARARIIQCPVNLTQAKRAATREFGGEMLDYTIVILDPRGECVASRKVGAKNWSN